MKKSIATLLMLTFLTSTSLGGTLECLNSAAQRYHVSPLLLESIIQVESDGNPYSFNIQFISKEAKRYFLDNLNGICKVKEQKTVSISCRNIKTAKIILKTIEKYKNFIKTYDIGLMQINKFWIDTFNLNPEWLLDSCYSVNFGAYVLSYNISLFGYNWKAVWKYNGSKKYLSKIVTQMEKICRQEQKDNFYCEKYFK